MLANKLILKMIMFFYVLLSVLSCTANKVMDDNMYTSIDLSLVNQNDWTMSDDILYLINMHREEEAKRPLIKDSLYASAYAVKHSKYMISTGNASHDYFYLRSDELKNKGAIHVSENIAYGYASAQSVVNAWLKSEPHRKIIEGDYYNIGFGVLKSLDNKYYFTTLFYK